MTMKGKPTVGTIHKAKKPTPANTGAKQPPIKSGDRTTTPQGLKFQNTKLSATSLEKLDAIVQLMRDDLSLRRRKKAMGLPYKHLGGRVVGDMVYEILKDQILREQPEDDAGEVF